MSIYSSDNPNKAGITLIQIMKWRHGEKRYLESSKWWSQHSNESGA
jgi:hypothetical protein